jgi:hypothetical protein
MIVVTHYQRLLNYIVPDFVHVLAEGRIVKSGGKELALELEEALVPAAPALLPAQIASGVQISKLSEAPRELVEPYLARYASYQTNAFVALNTANFEDGLFIHIAKGAVIEEPIELGLRVLRQRPSHRLPPAHSSRSGTR